jgi:lysophospholipase L1-like esterase
MSCKILILGDSSSSSIGAGDHCYPVKLYQMLQGDLDVHVLNCAVPGSTSADMSCFFQKTLRGVPFDYVIIYLGNNEGTDGYHKGAYHPLKETIKSCFFKRPVPKLQPVLSPVPHTFSYSVSSLGSSVRPSEFSKNLKEIIHNATKSGAKVILINPIANYNFPSGVAAKNSTFFCFYDELNSSPLAEMNNAIDDDSKALILGLKLLATGRIDQAIDIWTPLSIRNNVLGFIAKHNIAFARVQNGQSATLAELEELIGEYKVYDSIILHNLAKIMEAQGSTYDAKSNFKLAYEKDSSSYRIKQEYRDVIFQLSSLKNVQIIDLGLILNSVDFVDYCHPTEDGHIKIAKALEKIILPKAPYRRKTERASYKNLLPSPNFSREPNTTLINYYSIDWEIDNTQIKKALTQVAKGNKSDEKFSHQIALCVENFIKVNNRHPIFTPDLNQVDDLVPRSNEILSFPEFYLSRILYNYSQIFEKEALAESLSLEPLMEKVRLSAKDYKKIIIRNNDASLKCELNLTSDYFNYIFQRVKEQILSKDTIYRVTIDERIRTIITWYTREAFRYGTQSRISMLYAYSDIEELIEGLIVALVIAVRNKLDVIASINQILSDLLALIKVHEKWAQLYQQQDKSFSYRAYGNALANIEGPLKAYVMQLP